MQGHSYGNLLEVVNYGDLIRAVAVFLGLAIPEDKLTGSFSLQEMDGVVPGSLYKRTCNWGVGRCQCLEFGSYNLTKILDEDGEKIEPYYSKWTEYSKDLTMFAWAGFKSKEAMDEAIEAYKARAGHTTTEL